MVFIRASPEPFPRTEVISAHNILDAQAADSIQLAVVVVLNPPCAESLTEVLTFLVAKFKFL